MLTYLVNRKMKTTQQNLLTADPLSGILGDTKENE